MNQAGKAKPLQESKLATGITRTDNGWWTVDKYWWIVGQMKKNVTRTKTYWFTGTITLCKYITVNVQVLSHPAWSSNSSQRPHWICGERLWKMMWPLHHPWLHFHPFQVVGILIVLLGLYSFYRYFASHFFFLVDCMCYFWSNSQYTNFTYRTLNVEDWDWFWFWILSQALGSLGKHS